MLAAVNCARNSLMSPDEHQPAPMYWTVRPQTA